MNYDEITTIADIDRVLLNFQIQLDGCEYDESEDFDSKLDELYPGEVTKAAKRAAELGSRRGKHLYGRLLMDRALRAEDKGQPFEDLRTEARKWVMEAARMGCWGAMTDLGSEYATPLGVPLELQLIYYHLADEDVYDYVTYHRQYLGAEISDDQVEKSLAAARQLQSEMESEGIQRKSCECIFP